MKSIFAVSFAVALTACSTAAVQQAQSTRPQSAEAAAIEFNGELATIILEGGLEITAPRVSWQVHDIDGQAVFLNPPMASWLSVMPADPEFIEAVLRLHDREIVYMCVEEVCSMTYQIEEEDEDCMAQAMMVSINTVVDATLYGETDVTPDSEAAPFDLCRRLVPMSGEYPAQIHIWAVGDELMVRAEYESGNPNAQVIISDALALVRDLAGLAQPVE